MGDQKKHDFEEYLSDEEIEALLNEPEQERDDEEDALPVYQRGWIRKTIGFVLVLVLLGNILAFWPKVYSIAAIQFLAKSAELYQNEQIQSYKEAVVVVKAGDSKGTGFNIAEEGIIVTNHHVVEDSRQLMVHFADGRSFSADIVASDSVMDIAILEIEANQLPILTLANSAGKEKDAFYVIGNPLFFTRIANEGTVIGIHPTIEPERLMLQAPIYKGNSGSPVINETGEVIAVVYATTKVRHVNGGTETVGLAIPIEQVHQLLHENDF